MTTTCGGNCQSDATQNTPQTAEVHDASHGGFVSEYHVPKMDCPSEEGMIRMALDSVEPKVTLEFDTLKRKVRVYHGDNADLIEKRMQSEDRAHRIGQKKTVTYVDIIADDTVDTKIVKSLRKKINIASKVMGEELKQWI